MIPFVLGILRPYAPILTLPAAIVVGIVGSILETMISDRKTPCIESVEERRRRRQQEEGKLLISPEPIADPIKTMQKTILDRNLPPSLISKDS